MNILFSNRVTQAFIRVLINISNRLGIDPNWLMFLMDWESGISSTRENSFGCLGLIQFCPDYSGGSYKTINGVTYDLQSLKMMLPEDQLEVVYQYLAEIQKDKGKFDDYYDLYFAILFPAAYGKPDNYVLDTQTNQIFDLNRNGSITVGEVKQYLDNRVREKVPQAYWDIFFKKKTSFSYIEEKSLSGELSLV